MTDSLTAAAEEYMREAGAKVLADHCAGKFCPDFYQAGFRAGASFALKSGVVREMAEALETGRQYFTAIDTPSKFITLKECELLRGEFLEAQAKALAAYKSACGKQA